MEGVADVDVRWPFGPGPYIVEGSTGRQGLESHWPGAIAEAQGEGRREAHTFKLFDRVPPGMFPSLIYAFFSTFPMS